MTLAIHLVGIHSCLLCSNTVWGTLGNLTHTETHGQEHTHIHITLLTHNGLDIGFRSDSLGYLFSVWGCSPVLCLYLEHWSVLSSYMHELQKKKRKKKKMFSLGWRKRRRGKKMTGNLWSQKSVHYQFTFQVAAWNSFGLWDQNNKKKKK